MPSTSPHCRISRIRMKDGGQEIAIFPGTIKNEGHGDLIDAARSVTLSFEGVDIAGFAIVAWDADLTFDTAFMVTEGTPCDLNALPTFVHGSLVKSVYETLEEIRAT